MKEHRAPARPLIWLALFVSCGTASQGQTDSADATQALREGKLSRWLSFDQLSLNSTYRRSFNTYGRSVFDDAQQQIAIKGKVKLDKNGKYFIGFRTSAGTGFNWSYSKFAADETQSALSSGDSEFPGEKILQLKQILQADPMARTLFSGSSGAAWSTTVRDLYLSASPGDFLTFQFGAMPILQGDGSSITGFDDQQNVLGGRISLNAKPRLWLDSLSATVGYLGDPLTPNLFDRGERFTQTNYWQVAAEKHLGKFTQMSLDYTNLQHTHTWREALSLNVHKTKLLDSVRGEMYERTNDVLMAAYTANAANGWAISGFKSVDRNRLTVGGGFSDIDPDYGVYTGSSLLTVVGFPVNSGAYQIGERYFGQAELKVTTYLSFITFFTHEINANRSPLYFDFNRQGLNAGMRFDFGNILSDKLHLY
jgi:hypothetical protein